MSMIIKLFSTLFMTFFDRKNKRNKNVKIFNHVLIIFKVQDSTFKEIVFDENIFIVKTDIKC